MKPFEKVAAQWQILLQDLRYAARTLKGSDERTPLRRASRRSIDFFGDCKRSAPTSAVVGALRPALRAASINPISALKAD
jgi:hypothetical protein